jgi:hypothetical protein
MRKFERLRERECVCVCVLRPRSRGENVRAGAARRSQLLLVGYWKSSTNSQLENTLEDARCMTK